MKKCEKKTERNSNSPRNSVMEETVDVLMVSGPAKKLFDLASPVIKEMLNQTYLAPADPSVVGQEYATIFKVQIAKSVVDLPVQYKDKLVHVFFILNSASEVTALRKDALEVLTGNDNAEIPKFMKVKINGCEHEIVPSYNLGRDDVLNVNILGDDFLCKYCTEMVHFSVF